LNGGADADAIDAASSSSDCDADQMERLIVLYLANNRSCEFEESALYLLTPFMSVLSDPCDVYFCFSTLREYIDAVESQGIENLLAKFMMLFRTFEGDLCTHFEDEELRPNEWAIPWLRHFLCKVHLLNLVSIELTACFGVGTASALCSASLGHLLCR
jgi:hypothetical protein